MKKARATLDRILSKAGIASRTTTREWIEQGRVKINGRIVRNPEFWVEQKDVVNLDGARIRDQKKIYIALNKPAEALKMLQQAKTLDATVPAVSCVQD